MCSSDLGLSFHKAQQVKSFVIGPRHGDTRLSETVDATHPLPSYALRKSQGLDLPQLCRIFVSVIILIITHNFETDQEKARLWPTGLEGCLVLGSQLLLLC